MNQATFPVMLGLTAMWLGVAQAADPIAATPAAPTALFADDEMIRITIKGPIKDIVKRRKTVTEPFPGELKIEGAVAQALPIELSARGNFRRKSSACQFPPLRIRFTQKPGESSVFHQQGKLKLVTHCRNSDGYEQYALKEYTAYRLFNHLTDASFRTRLADISYVNEDDGKQVARRIGFFIEGVDDVAARNGMVEVERPKISRSQLSVRHAGDAALFQFMIGNLDWSFLRGPEGDDCCHNVKVAAQSAESAVGLVPLPYDFDHAGFVNPPYAEPPPTIQVRNVRQRRYRGLCDHNEAAAASADRFLNAKTELLSIVDSVPAMTDATREAAKDYLEGFFKIIADERRFQQTALSRCRK